MKQILDHGYVKYVEHWGKGEAGLDEAAIIEAARQSTQGSFRGWETDAKLLRFLYEHKHSTPFEFAGLTIEVQAPLFVFREWHRHRTQSYNEMSARYTPMPDLNYLPEASRFQPEPGKNKQAGTIKGAPEMTLEEADRWRELLEASYAQAEFVYQRGLAQGVPKEIARLCIPVGRYSRMRATANLRNWLGFLTLRTDPAAQWEIREYANAVGEIIAERFPQTWELFKEGRNAQS